MKVVIAGVGTRGDIQPLLLLGRSLREVGHDAFVCAPPDFAWLAAELEVPFQPLGRPFMEMQREIQAAFEKHPIRTFLSDIVGEMLSEQARLLPGMVAGTLLLGFDKALTGPIPHRAGRARGAVSALRRGGPPRRRRHHCLRGSCRRSPGHVPDMARG